MLNMKRTKIMLIMILAIAEVCSIFLTWKSLSHKVTIIDDVKFKEENKKEKKTVAIMLNEGDGSYKESTSTTFPKVGYIYNSEKSGCIDTTGKEVVNAINYESGKVSLRLNQKLYCYLYFDKKEKPIIDKFYINDETSNKTTKVPEVTIYLKWSDQYIKEYCITETQDIDSCTWQSTNGVIEINNNFTLSNNRGNKILYAYIKDIAEGISEAKSDYILYNPPITGGSIVEDPNPGTNGGSNSSGVEQDELKIRYYGTNPNNYICFGTSDKNICINETNKYMYRIIGVDKSNRFKIIKKEALSERPSWWSDTTTNINWPNSTIYKSLSNFLKNNTYLPTLWINKIETVNWKYGNIPVENQTAEQVLRTEQAWNTTINSKIGLINLSDYFYSVKLGGENCFINGKQCTESWLHLGNNQTVNQGEWTMSRYGLGADGKYLGWFITVYGTPNHYYLYDTNSIRPVFYLIPSIEISGTGTQTDPYIIVS